MQLQFQNTHRTLLACPALTVKSAMGSGLNSLFGWVVILGGNCGKRDFTESRVFLWQTRILTHRA